MKFLAVFVISYTVFLMVLIGILLLWDEPEDEPED